MPTRTTKNQLRIQTLQYCCMTNRWFLFSNFMQNVFLKIYLVIILCWSTMYEYLFWCIDFRQNEEKASSGVILFLYAVKYIFTSFIYMLYRLIPAYIGPQILFGIELLLVQITDFVIPNNIHFQPNAYLYGWSLTSSYGEFLWLVWQHQHPGERFWDLSAGGVLFAGWKTLYEGKEVLGGTLGSVKRSCIYRCTGYINSLLKAAHSLPIGFSSLCCCLTFPVGRKPSDLVRCRAHVGTTLLDGVGETCRQIICRFGRSAACLCRLGTYLDLECFVCHWQLPWAIL